MKIPVSVLVVIYTTGNEVLLLERADHPGYWQSVTGSLDLIDEPLIEAAARELFEETGIDVDQLPEGALRSMDYSVEYEIYPQWRHRYPPGVVKNTEHWFKVELPARVPVTLAAKEAGRMYQQGAAQAVGKAVKPVMPVVDTWQRAIS